ncbi:general stress protein [Sphingomonas sp. R1]|uniref:general stress protein n=1 Tax=Sphingomonas sp. R1 TaxID=399176 RepID=UPI0022255F45|nr:general stress protein [Sphingomonas sp. R1]UYY78714.1 hypothetical protein OIM94_06960 [Sphingomonas sp. R1]
MSRTITRLFDDYSDAKAAVHDLEQLGVPHDDLSIIANNAHGEHGDHDVSDVNAHGDVSRGASTGAALGGVGGLLAGLGLLAIPGLGPIVAAGWLASTAAGAAIGGIGGAATGSLVGALKNAGESEDDANVYSEGVRRGGTLVSARVAESLAPEAEAVLNRHRGVDAGTRGAAYRQSGWSRFDSDAPAYTREEIARERSTYREPTIV